MSKQQIMVDEFHEKMGATTGPHSPIEVRYRLDFIKEEVKELDLAMYEDDMAHAIDALCDLLYVVYGTAVSMGVNLDPFFAEVHRSNMTKTPNGNGKAVKGPNYESPRIAAMLANRWWPSTEKKQTGDAK